MQIVPSKCSFLRSSGNVRDPPQRVQLVVPGSAVCRSPPENEYLGDTYHMGDLASDEPSVQYNAAVASAGVASFSKGVHAKCTGSGPPPKRRRASGAQSGPLS